MRNRTPHWTLAFAAIAIAALATGCSPKNDKSDAASVTAGTVKLTDDQLKHIRLYTVTPTKWRKTIDATGAVDFDNDQATSVLAPFSGPVTRLLVSPGEKVRKDQQLAVVESPDFAAAVDAYRKAVATAATNRRLADLDKDLLKHQGVSQREADQAETDAVGAEADRYAALRALASLNIDPHDLKEVERGRPLAHIEGIIRSPIAGTVVEKLITPGELLQAGSTVCFTVADVSRVWVLAQIFDSDIASVALGDTAQIATGIGANTVAGTVTNIPALVDPNTRSVNVRVTVDNPAGLLKKQMYVHVQIQSRRENTGLLAPVSAVLRDDENLPFVYVVQRDGGFAREHVTLGYRAGDLYDIPEGVHSGDRVVVDGGLFIQFMQSQ
ncbi:MAG: efflux RND transporter periplasmic adaptor subunit [Rhizomicrobium sp.]|jgi:cobalt-zinc-cadmium efflux system membrane fusion protein